MPELIKKSGLHVMKETCICRCPVCDTYIHNPISNVGLSGLEEYDKILLSIIEILKANGAGSEECSAITMAMNRLVELAKQKGRENLIEDQRKSRSREDNGNAAPELRQMQAAVQGCGGCRTVRHDGSRQPESCDGAKMPALQIPPKRLD